MTVDEYWNNMTSSDKLAFQRACRNLLKQTFVVRDKDDLSRKLYHFISRNEEMFVLYFSFMGFDIILDREDGVAMLANHGSREDNEDLQTNHVRLRRIDSIILCALWTLYADRMREGKLSRTYQVTVTDVSFALEKFGYRETLDKTTLRNTLTLLSRYNLISVQGNIGEPDCLIILYPSLQFALSKEAFQNMAQSAAVLMSQGRKKGEFGEIEAGEAEGPDEE